MAKETPENILGDYPENLAIPYEDIQRVEVGHDWIGDSLLKVITTSRTIKLTQRDSNIIKQCIALLKPILKDKLSG